LCIKRKATMPFSHSIEDINECLQSIARVHDLGYFTIHVVVGRDTYELKFNNENICSENVGVFTYIGSNVYTEEEDKIQNNIIDCSNIIGENITNIKISEEHNNDIYDDNGNTYGCMLVEFLNGEDNILFTLEFYNWHNGYYPHDLIVNSYEGDSDEGVQIVKTFI
jgi:hypothetical protein